MLFIYPNINSGNIRHFHFGIGSISAVLEKEGFGTSLMDISKEINKENFLAQIDKYDPDLIGFSITTNQWPYAKLFCNWIKEHRDTPIVCGGNHPTQNPEEVILEKDVDIVCIGEGEYSILDLMRKLKEGDDITQIRNLWVKTAQGVIKNPLRPLIEDLDNLPFLNRKIFDYDNLLKETGYAAIVMAGRGCPYSCTYCSNPAFNELYRGKGKIVRRQSPPRVISELKYLKRRYKIELFDFMDEVFTIDQKWLMQFLRYYKRKIHIPFHVMVRPENLSKAMLQEMKDSGCELIRIGIESGNQWIREKVLNRKMSNEQILNAFQMAEDVGMKTYAFIMLGLPYETPEMIEETIELIKKIRPNHTQVSTFYPFPGTKLYQLCKGKGYLTDKVVTSYLSNSSILNFPQITSEQIRNYALKMGELNFQIKVKKERQGYFDFLVNLDKARVIADNPAKAWISIFGDYYDMEVVLVEEPSCKVTYKVKLGRNTLLKTGVALGPYVYSNTRDHGVEFRIELSSEKEKEVLFSKYMDPNKNPKDRRWHDVKIDLSRFEGKEVEISFITEGLPSYTYNPAGWKRPYLGKNVSTVRRLWSLVK